MARNGRPLARQRALRALAEGARPTLELLSAVSGLSVRGLRGDAEKEGWALVGEPKEDVSDRLRALASALLDRVEALGLSATVEGGRIDKGKIDAIMAMIRGLDKIGEIMRPGDGAAKENQIRQDEDLAKVLRRINDKILELATEIAGEICAGAGRPQGG